MTTRGRSRQRPEGVPAEPGAGEALEGDITQVRGPQDADTTVEAGGDVMTTDARTTEEAFSHLISRRQIPGRGVLAPEPAPEELALEQRQRLIRELLMEEEHILEVLRAIRPDMLRDAFQQLGEVGRELQQMAYLEWMHGTFQMLSQVARLTRYTIQIQKQNLKDAGIDISDVDKEMVPYTALTQVFQRLSERLAQRASGVGQIG